MQQALVFANRPCRDEWDYRPACPSRSANVATDSRGHRWMYVVTLLWLGLHPANAWAESSGVKIIRVPHQGIQPQVVVGHRGEVHLVYFHGEPSAGDIYYVRTADDGESFSAPLRVNSQPGSAIAVGTIRGAHLALGRDDRVHVAWNGSGQASPKGLPNPELPADSPYRLSAPMLYSRMADDGMAFEPQRNLMSCSYALDGGGSLAADAAGYVYVVWHGNPASGGAGEGRRAVWVATSRDDGSHFQPEHAVNPEPTGACGCCGLRAAVDNSGRLCILYRTAKDEVERDTVLLVSHNQGVSCRATRIDPWHVDQCVMSSGALAASGQHLLAAWETEQQVKFGRFDPAQATLLQVIMPDVRRAVRKHPAICANSAGQVILAWTEGTGWQNGGAVAWQVFDSNGLPVTDAQGRADGVPVWSLVSVFPGRDGQFRVVY